MFSLIEGVLIEQPTYPEVEGDEELLMIEVIVEQEATMIKGRNVDHKKKLKIQLFISL